MGICAGAYFFSERPDGASLPLSGARAIDIEHDNRGHGNVAFTLTDEGRQLFGAYAALDTLYCMYYEGPVLVPVGTYTEFATMQSDVHEEGDAPAGMTVDRPFFLGAAVSSVIGCFSTVSIAYIIARSASGGHPLANSSQI